jgi:hypothetical protein
LRSSITDSSIRVSFSSGLAQRLSDRKRRGHRDVERAQRRLDRDLQPRVGGAGDSFRHARTLAPEQQDVRRLIAKIKIGRGALGGEQQEAVSPFLAPLFEFRPGIVTHQGNLIEIIHPGPAEVAVGHRESRRLDDMGGHVQAGAEAQDRAGVLGNVGLKQRDLHPVMSRSKSKKKPNHKSSV